MTIASALPFAVLLASTYGLIKALRVGLYKRENLQMNSAPVGPCKDRLHNIVGDQ